MEKENEVKDEGVVEEASTPETPEDVSSTAEVKKAEEPVDSGKSVEELQNQINNLNIALKQERTASKTKSDEFENKLSEYQETNERLKNAFAPKEEESEPEKVGMTQEEMENFYEEKEKEREQKSIDDKRIELIQSEIKELETKYDGKDNGLKYDDEEMIQWQRDNNKSYLSPKEAFEMKYKNELIDLEVKRRIAGKAPVENVETSSAQASEHTPKKEVITDTRAAVLEAMNNAEKEM